MDLDAEFLGRRGDALPGRAALRVGDAFDLIEAGDGVADVGRVLDRLLALFGERELRVVDVVALLRGELAHGLSSREPNLEHRQSPFPNRARHRAGRYCSVIRVALPPAAAVLMLSARSTTSRSSATFVSPGARPSMPMIGPGRAASRAQTASSASRPPWWTTASKRTEAALQSATSSMRPCTGAGRRAWSARASSGHTALLPTDRTAANCTRRSASSSARHSTASRATR